MSLRLSTTSRLKKGVTNSHCEMARCFAARCTFLSLLPLLLILLAGSSFPVLHATSEGDTLVAMMMKWNVTFPGWVRGGDPCAQNWTHVTCRGGKVVELNVTTTGIQGSIPDDIGELPDLEVLDISNANNALDRTPNVLSGEFPESFAKCAALKSFNASNMDWNIRFPLVLTKLSNLEELYFSGGQLRGTIPDDLSKLGNLRYLFLGTNQLEGSLTKFVRLTNLVLLSLNSNDFSEPLSPLLVALDKLEYFNCHTCKLYGPLPHDFSKFKSLKNLTLQRNALTGTIPSSWRNLTTLRYLRLDQNYLSGAFPSWMMSSWPSLSALNLAKNSFSGPAPSLRDLENVYNVTYTYWALKWDCNYLNGLSPCSDIQLCSNHTNDMINSKSFNFDQNCYEDYGEQDMSEVQNNCYQYHPSDISCTMVYNYLANGICLPCPNGQVPDKSSRGKFNGNCVCKLGHSKQKINISIIVGVVVPGGVLLLIGGLISLVTILRLRKQVVILKEFQQELSNRNVKPPFFSYHELKVATRDFHIDNKLGSGAFGAVYKGILHNKNEVAVKKLFRSNLQAHVLSDFLNEVVLITGIKHKNLVQLLGCCINGNERILVYEFAERGNVADALWGNKLQGTVMTWEERLKICRGVAWGLCYLHEELQPRIIHRDIKAANVLIDKNLNAKIADFGLAIPLQEEDTRAQFSLLAGTKGYFAPEYVLDGLLTEKADVYSFGILVLEIVSGKRCIDPKRLPNEISLKYWAETLQKQGRILEILPSELHRGSSHDEVIRVINIALLCVDKEPKTRPTMSQVVSMLAGINEDALFLSLSKNRRSLEENENQLYADSDWTSLSLWDGKASTVQKNTADHHRDDEALIPSREPNSSFSISFDASTSSRSGPASFSRGGPVGICRVCKALIAQTNPY